MNSRISDLQEKLNLYNLAAGNTVIFSVGELLSLHSSFKIGGPADIFISPLTTDALKFTIVSCKENKIPFYVIGRGSNILFDDAGYRGAVISTSRLSGLSLDGNVLNADAGALLADVVKFARDNSLGGISYLYGIPGSVGGAVYMNAGAYVGEIADTLTSSTYLDCNNGDIFTLTRDEITPSYRFTSYMNFKERVILSAKFSLIPSNPDDILAECRDYMSRRIEKQPLDYPSAGSAFKRAPGHFTAKLIDDCNLKGFRIGGAAVSEKHAGFIINLGGATSKDVLALMQLIKNRVFDTFGVKIESEIIYLCPTQKI